MLSSDLSSFFLLSTRVPQMCVHGMCSYPSVSPLTNLINVNDHWRLTFGCVRMRVCVHIIKWWKQKQQQRQREKKIGFRWWKGTLPRRWYRHTCNYDVLTFFVLESPSSPPPPLLLSLSLSFVLFLIYDDDVMCKLINPYPFRHVVMSLSLAHLALSTQYYIYIYKHNIVTH